MSKPKPSARRSSRRISRIPQLTAEERQLVIDALLDFANEQGYSFSELGTVIRAEIAELVGGASLSNLPTLSGLLDSIALLPCGCAECSDRGTGTEGWLVRWEPPKK